MLDVVEPLADRRGEHAVGHDQTGSLSRPRAARRAKPGFDPVRPVMFATVRRSEHDDSVAQIADAGTAKCTDLLNVGYEVLLQTLERYFRGQTNRR